MPGDAQVGSELGLGETASLAQAAQQGNAQALLTIGGLYLGASLLVLMLTTLIDGGILLKFLSLSTFLMAGVMVLFEALVQFLQAFVFAVLTCIYLNDVVNLDHAH